MKKITNAGFGYGRLCGLNLLRGLARTENGLCCAAEMSADENLDGETSYEAHY